MDAAAGFCLGRLPHASGLEHVYTLIQIPSPVAVQYSVSYEVRSLAEKFPLATQTHRESRANRSATLNCTWPVPRLFKIKLHVKRKPVSHA
jgi:hypothetical protein